MITHPTQQEKNETTKRRMIRRTGLPVSCFAPFTRVEPRIVEVDFSPLAQSPQCMDLPACDDCGSLFHGENSVACVKRDGEFNVISKPGYDIAGLDSVKAALSIVADAAPAPKDETARFRIEYRCTVTDSWIHFPSDTTTIAANANDLLPRCRELACGQVGVKFRIIRPDGKRAIHRVAARPVKGRPSKLETYSWSS